MLPVPPHFDPETVGEVWRVPYEERAREAEAWSREHELRPAAEDASRICLVAVDVQNTFCIPGFELFVGGRSGTGAVDDNRRLCEFLYRNLDVVTQVVPTLDTHQAMQVFHAIWLIDEEGRHPQPYTQISAADVAAGRWRVDPGVAEALGLEPDYAKRHLAHYTSALAATGRYELTIWPYHALLGGIGNALVSAVHEAIFFHAIARRSQPAFQPKGAPPAHRALLGARPRGDARSRRRAARRKELAAARDAVLVRRRRDRRTGEEPLRRVDDRRPAGLAVPGLAQKVYLLEDCTSPVVVPGVADYTYEADAAFERFAGAGMHVVRSDDPIESWPGIAALARGQSTSSRRGFGR